MKATICSSISPWVSGIFLVLSSNDQTPATVAHRDELSLKSAQLQAETESSEASNKMISNTVQF